MHEPVLLAEGEDDDTCQGPPLVHGEEKVPLPRVARIMSCRYPRGLLMVNPYLRSAVSSIQPWNVSQAPSKSSGSTTSTPSLAALRTP